MRWIQIEQHFGTLNPKAPRDLSRFAFLIGRWKFDADPHTTCTVNLSIPNGTGTGSANSNVSASPSGCSGIFGVYGNVGGKGTQNAVDIVVPPQLLIQVLYGEAHGQAVTGDAVSEPAIGATIRNRFGDAVYFSGVTTYQAAITPGQFESIASCQAANNCVETGAIPELYNAALIFGGVTTDAMNVANAKCFFSPVSATDWGQIQAALNNAAITVVPKVQSDPGLLPSSQQAIRL